MKRVLSCGAVALLLLVAADASAQSKLSGFIAAGPATTTGDLKDADSTKSGFTFQGGLEYKISTPLWFRIDASMGFFDRVTNFAEDAYIWTFAGRLEYWLPMGSDKLRPYVVGGAGIMSIKRNPGETGAEDVETFATKHRSLISAGAGVDYQLGGTSIFLEGRYEMGGDDRSMIPIVIGMRWGARQ